MMTDDVTAVACRWCLKAVAVNPPCCEQRRRLKSHVGEHRGLPLRTGGALYERVLDAWAEAQQRRLSGVLECGCETGNCQCHGGLIR